MPITISQLCKYAKEDYGMELICGEKNMGNLVEWVHMLEDPETAHFLHGRELIFSTGIGHSDTSWFVAFAKGLMENNASGLVLNIGPYIQEVPKELIDYCQEHQFPLMSVPWKTRIVDITNEFCHRIIEAEETETTVSEAFRELIISPDKIPELRPILEKKSFNLNAEFCVMTIALQVNKAEDFMYFEKQVRLHLTKALYKLSDRFNIFSENKSLVVVLQDFPEHFILQVFDRIKDIVTTTNRTNHIHGGISGNDYGVLSLPRSHKRAQAVMRIAKKQSKDIMTYNESGIYQLLIEVDDMKVLKKFYDQSLGQIVDYDLKNETDLLTILKLYLDYNHSVERVAKETYVHRNTVNYKIKKIKEILDCELTYEDGVRLLLAYHIHEFI
jgi:hypothetical protein